MTKLTHWQGGEKPAWLTKIETATGHAYGERADDRTVYLAIDHSVSMAEGSKMRQASACHIVGEASAVDLGDRLVRKREMESELVSLTKLLAVASAEKRSLTRLPSVESDAPLSGRIRSGGGRGDG